jgi:hypothetical protein
MITPFYRWFKRLFRKHHGHAYSIQGWVRGADGVYVHTATAGAHPNPDTIFRAGGVWVRQTIGEGSVKYPSLRAAIEHW